MNTPKLLSGLFVVQVLLAAATWWPRGAAVATPTPLFEGGGNAITKLSIVGSGADAVPVTLATEGGKWILTSSDGFPADPEKLAEVVDALAAIKLAEPIATQSSSYDQLKVSDTTFDKKVTFTANNTEHTLIVGASASKSIYLRVDGGTDVYQAKGLSAWTFKDSARGFLGSNFIDVDKATLSALTVTNATGTVELVHTGDVWSLGGANPGPADQTAVNALLDKATKVRLAEPLGSDDVPSYGLDAPTVRVTYTVVDGDSSTQGSYSIGSMNDGKYYVRADGSPFVASSPSYRIDDLISATADALAAPESTAPAGFPGQP